jgi:hypothetical protein
MGEELTLTVEDIDIKTCKISVTKAKFTRLVLRFAITCLLK